MLVLRSTLILVAVTALAAAGCSSGPPPPIPTGEATVAAADGTVSTADGTVSAEPVLDLRTPENDTDGGNPGVVATQVPAPPTTTIRVASSATSAATATATAPPSTPPAPTAPATTAATTAPTTVPSTSRPADGSGGLVEFRIRPGTGSGAWNRFDSPVVVVVGQTLRIHNDDSVAHSVHSNGSPFVHGASIPPGGFADHPIVEPLTPIQGAPTNYDHDAGTGAPFWVVSRTAEAPTTTIATTTTTANTSATETTGSAGPAELVAAEAESLRLLNELRTGLGLQPVSPTDQEMHAFARAWSLEMRTSGFRHSDPPRWYENIVWYSDEAMTPSEAAAQFHDMWVNSPGHYRNMTNPEWTVVGVGMWHDESGWWGVHVFR